MSELASYLRDLAIVGAETPEARTIVALFEASRLLDAGADPRTVLERLAAADLPGPYSARVTECLAECKARDAAVSSAFLDWLAVDSRELVEASASNLPGRATSAEHAFWERA